MGLFYFNSGGFYLDVRCSPLRLELSIFSGNRSSLLAAGFTFSICRSTFSPKLCNPPNSYSPYKTKKASGKPKFRSLNALYVYMNLAIKLSQRFLVTLLLLNRCARSLHLKKLVFCGNPHSRGLNGVTL